MLFRRFTADLTPLLQYIVHQLYNGATTETVVLKELIMKLAGIEPLPNLSDSQVITMAGGPILRIEAIASTTRGARADPNDTVLKGPARLGKALTESGLARPLLIQIAQQRQAAAHQSQNTHLKALAGLFDGVNTIQEFYLKILVTKGDCTDPWHSDAVSGAFDFAGGKRYE